MNSYNTITLRNRPLSRESKPVPIVLTIAGSDPSGGAGIEADLKTFSSFGVFGATCIVALTAQNTKGVNSISKTSEILVNEILESIFDDYLQSDGSSRLRTIKTGMLTQEAVKVLEGKIDLLDKEDVKLVVDPVMVSTSGASLFKEEDMQQCVTTLLKHAYLVTPNFEEALVLYSLSNSDGSKDLNIKSVQDFVDFTINLQQSLKCENILVKGGHIPWDANDKPINGKDFKSATKVRDVLYESSSGTVTIFESEFIHSQNTHGTGCTLSSSIAANIAKGKNLRDSLIISIDYLHQGLDSMTKIGHGNGPLNHNVIPEQDISSLTKSVLSNPVSVSNKIKEEYDSFLDFFKSQPLVVPYWKKYIEHPFVNQVATNQLPFDKFLYFLKQDYFYLINYAQVQCLAASVAPTYQETLATSKVVEAIVTEIEKHKVKLHKKYDVDYDSNSDNDLRPGKACINYCTYLLEIGKKEDYIGIKTAIAPCLFGYYEAGVIGQERRQRRDYDLGSLSNKEESEVYGSWIDEYTLDWYREAYEVGKVGLDKYLNEHDISQERVDQLTHIFAEVTKLEVAFWDEVLDLE